jgi:hypothetical protein
MMTTSSAVATPTAEERPATEPAAERRFLADLIQVHADLRYPGLPAAIEGEPLCRLEGYDDGLVTLSVRESQLPERYVRAILGFRLAQFIQTDLMDRSLVYQRALFHEPIPNHVGPDTIHTVTLTESGKLVGYLGLVGSDDPEPLPLDSPGRALFPVEAAHKVELLSRYAAPHLTTHQVWEIKRFIKDRSMEAGMQRDRVPWHLILAIGRVGTALGNDARVIVGDSSEHGALRHLRIIGFDFVVVEDSGPSLPHTELMWPSYLLPKERLAKPFSALIHADLPDYMEVIDSALRDVRDEAWQLKALGRLNDIRRESGLHEVVGLP